jgi:hypothetical protein
MSERPEGEVRMGRSIRTWLFNAFQYVAGWPALTFGLVLMLAAGALASAAGGRFDGTLDFHQAPPGYAMPRWAFLIDAAAAWVPLSCLLWVGGRLISKSRFRTIDVFGTQALARVPMLLTALACTPPGVRRYMQHLLEVSREALAQFGQGAGQAATPPSLVGGNPLDAVAFFVCMAVVLVALVWMVALMYRAFAVSCNVRGGRAIAVFIAALILAEAASKVIVIAASAH